MWRNARPIIKLPEPQIDPFHGRPAYLTQTRVSYANYYVDQLGKQNTEEMYNMKIETFNRMPSIKNNDILHVRNTMLSLSRIIVL